MSGIHKEQTILEKVREEGRRSEYSKKKNPRLSCVKRTTRSVPQRVEIDESGRKIYRVHPV